MEPGDVPSAVELGGGDLLGLGFYAVRRAPSIRRYLAEFSYRFSRRFSLREMFPRLAFVALRTEPMPYRVLKLAENYF